MISWTEASSWRKGKDLPFGVWGYPNVVILKEMVYIGGGITMSNLEQQTVVVYDPGQDSYNSLPPYA